MSNNVSTILKLVSSWTGGSQFTLIISNNSPIPITNWNLSCDTVINNQFNWIPNVTVQYPVVTGKTVITPATWNQNIAPNGCIILTSTNEIFISLF